MKTFRFRFWYEEAGTHTWVSLFAGQSFPGATLGKAGDFCLRNEEFAQFKAMLESLPFFEFCEKPKLRVGGKDESKWISNTK